MNTKYRIPVVVAGGFLLAGMLVLSLRAMRGDDMSGAGGTDRLASLEQRMEDDRKQMDARLARLESLLGAPRSATPNDPIAPPGSQAAADPEREAQRDQAFYQRVFAADPVGGDAQRRESTVSRAFTDPGVLSARFQPQTRNVECRANVCVIRAQFANGADTNEWVNRTLLALADEFTDSRLTSGVGPGGSTQMAIYAFRKGSGALLVDGASGEFR